ncbi:response regulator [uncultured Sphingomonas sp.]|uniref:response regulator n=1 Tax=uncultured Sphingomonas sp. TaxID=158754 RepID=UPI0030F57F6A
MSNLRNQILIVDDEEMIAMAFRCQIEDLGFVVCGTAATAKEAVDQAIACRPKLVLMDMRLRGEEDGVDAALAIHHSVGSRVIFVTGSKEPTTVERINLDHPWAILFKPVSYRQLEAAVKSAMED